MKKKEIGLLKKLQWRIECAAFLGVERLIALFPLQSLWNAGAGFSGIARIFASRWPTVRNNLRTVLGPGATEEQLATLTREVFRHTTANLITALKGAHMSLEEIREVLSIDGEATGERLMAQGKGIVMVVGHMGNWEFLAQAMPAFRPEIKIANIYRPLNNIYLEKILRERRERNGMTMFPKLSSFHAPLKFLKDNQILSLLVDQRAGRAGTITPFFGRLMSMSPFPEFIHRKTGAPILGTSLRTTAPGRWTVKFHEPDCRDGEAFTTAHMAALLEELIRESVVDEFWMQDLWRINKQRPLEIRGKRGPLRLERDRDKPLYPFSILLRIPDQAERFAELIPALTALAASRPDMDLHFLARKELRTVARDSKLPHTFHAIEDHSIPASLHLQLAIALTDAELPTRELARLFSGLTYSVATAAQHGRHWHIIRTEESLPAEDRWLEALRSLGMHDPPLEWEYV